MLLKLETINKFVNKFNIEIIKYNKSSNYKLYKLLNTEKIDLIIDCGANIGQYGRKLRNIGYENRIFSIEPIKNAFKILSNNIISDPLWDAKNCALGDYNKDGVINISENILSSSITNILPNHINVTPNAKVISKEIIKIYELDSLFKKIKVNSKNIFLKIDSQGFENKIINGAKNSLSSIIGIELELSLIPLYEGEILFIDMYNKLIKKGYYLVGIEPEFFNKKTGQQLQVNCIFLRKDSATLNEL